MSFLDDKHLARMQRFTLIYERMKNLEEFAKKNGIVDIFQDNGAKILQQLSILNLQNIEGREGNDGVDETGREWELKSTNLDTKSKSGFSTNHHLTMETIDKYRQANWSFAFYHGIHLESIYIMPGWMLESYYEKWASKLAQLKPSDDGNVPSLNNPHISNKFVLNNGIQVYPIDYDEPKDPSQIDYYFESVTE